MVLPAAILDHEVLCRSDFVVRIYGIEPVLSFLELVQDQYSANRLFASPYFRSRVSDKNFLLRVSGVGIYLVLAFWNFLPLFYQITLPLPPYQERKMLYFT